MKKYFKRIILNSQHCTLYRTITSANLFQGCQVLTHFTSNLTAPQIEKHYGERVRSRLREMCNWIEYKSDSFDKRKQLLYLNFSLIDTPMLVDSTSDFFFMLLQLRRRSGLLFFKIFNYKINETSYSNHHYNSYIYCRSLFSGNHLPRTQRRFPHHRTKKILHSENHPPV